MHGEPGASAEAGAALGRLATGVGYRQTKLAASSALAAPRWTARRG